MRKAKRSGKKVPAYRLHKPSGQAYVRADGRMHYLGLHGSPESFERYQEAIADWQSRQTKAPKGLTIGQLVLIYLRHAKQHYRKGGRLTSEFTSIKNALRHLLALFRKEAASEFSCRKLKAVRQCMVDAGWVRTSINRHVGRIVRMFKWGGAEELVPTQVYHDLKLLSGLQRGRTEAKEGEPVLPVPDAFIDAIQPHVTPTIWAMVQFQRYMGCRPGEVIRLSDNLNTHMIGAFYEAFLPAQTRTCVKRLNLVHTPKQRLTEHRPI